MLSFSAASFAQIGIGFSVRFGPPALPVYEQPPCPGAGYLCTPGYWSWSDDDGYYWVPGTWVMAPVGLLWTPGYWGWNDGAYLWHDGYWGPQVGFYGGINYGFGYTGEGFYGGEWRGRSFYYNGAVMNVRNTRITNVYEKTVIVNNNHVAFNGGQGGVSARPTAEQERFAHERHTAAVAAQREQMRAASHNRALFASQNHGRPAIAATEKPGDFKTHVVAAREAGAEYRAPAMSPREARAKAGENRPAESRNARRKPQLSSGRNSEEKRNAGENRKAANEESRANARGDAQQQKNEQKNTRREQAQQQKTEQQRNERQQAEQRKNEQKNTQRQQAQQQKAEQQRNERQQAEQRKNEQKNTQRQQAQQQKADAAAQ